MESESEYETDTDEEDEEEIIRPVFIPKAKRETIKEQELKMEQAKIRDEKKLLQEEDRKRQVLKTFFIQYLLFFSSLLPYYFLSLFVQHTYVNSKRSHSCSFHLQFFLTQPEHYQVTILANSLSTVPYFLFFFFCSVPFFAISQNSCFLDAFHES